MFFPMRTGPGKAPAHGALRRIDMRPISWLGYGLFLAGWLAAGAARSQDVVTTRTQTFRGQVLSVSEAGIRIKLDQGGGEHPVRVHEVSIRPLLHLAAEQCEIWITAVVLSNADSLVGLPLGQKCRLAAEVGTVAGSRVSLSVSIENSRVQPLLHRIIGRDVCRKYVISKRADYLWHFLSHHSQEKRPSVRSRLR